MKSAMVILLLALVLLTSGCSVPGLDFLGLGGAQVKEETSDILVIKSINAVPAEVSPGQQLRIITYIENKGKDTIPQPDLKKYTNPVNDKVSVELYDYCEGLFTVNDIQCNDRKAGSTDPKNTCNITRILPGQIIEVDWTLTPNSDIKLSTTCPVDGMKVRVTYPYRTTSLTVFTIINSLEMQRQLEAGTFQSKSLQITKGEGPIKPYIYVEDQQPVSQDSGSTVFSFQVENKGSGFLSGKSIPRENINITLPKDFCPEKGSQNECSFKKCSEPPAVQGCEYTIGNTDSLTLIYGKSPKLFCKIAIPQTKTEDFKGVCKPQKEAHPIAIEAPFPATVDIEYKYEFRATVSVAVVPKM